MKTAERKDITIDDLWKFEQYFKMGMEFGRSKLDKFIVDFYTTNNAAVAAFLREMQKYDRPQLEGSPASDANLPRVDKPGLNYFAPRRLLTALCQDEAFNKVRVNREKYTSEWLEQCMLKLMQSEHRDLIATLWSQENQRLKLKGGLIGSLLKAGVFKGSALNMARLYYHTTENTTEVRTLAKYMGDTDHYAFDGWIQDYVLIN